MSDSSHLDQKYFVSNDTYNCPFCNRRHVAFVNLGFEQFNWSNEKVCNIWRVRCGSCSKTSMHLTYNNNLRNMKYGNPVFNQDADLDSAFFYSVPTSFFVVDKRIPKGIRTLITEAEGCAKMNYLTGASACTRKGIYELLVEQEVVGANYDEKIKALAAKFSAIDAELFEILGHVKDMTSDHVHEQSWIAWDSNHLQLFLETFKAVLQEMYVVPDERKARAQSVRDLKERLSIASQAATKPAPA